jgi:hypothetical protein
MEQNKKAAEKRRCPGAAAVQCHGEQHEEPVVSRISTQQRTEEAANTTSKRESKSDHQKKFNLGQREAAQEKEKDAELRHMGNYQRGPSRSRPAKKR